MPGIRTTNIQSANLVASLIGNFDGNTVQIPLNLLKVLLSSEFAGPNYELRSELLADLAWDAGALGSVWGDPTESRRGVYQKTGARGAGSWSRIGDLPIASFAAADLASKAPLASPALTGIPTAPTAEAGADTIQIANTAFVAAALMQLATGSAPIRLEHISGDGQASVFGPVASQGSINIGIGQPVHFAWPGPNAADAPTLTIAGNTYSLRTSNGGTIQAGELRAASYWARIHSSTTIRVLSLCRIEDVPGLSDALTGVNDAISEEAAAREERDDALLGLADAGDIVRLDYQSGDAQNAVYTTISAQEDLTPGVGVHVHFTWTGANVAPAPTLTLDGTAYSLRGVDGSALAAGDLAARSYIGRIHTGSVIRLLTLARVQDVSGLQAALDSRAAMNSPALIGTPTAPTAAPGSASPQIANTEFVHGAIEGFVSSDLGNIVSEQASRAGQAFDFVGVTHSVFSNAKTYALPADAGTLTRLVLHSADATPVSAEVCVWSNSGGTLSLISSVPVNIVSGYNAFDVSLVVPANAMVGIRTTGASLYIGQNTALASTRFYLSGAAPAQTVTPSLDTRGIMLAATVMTRAERLSARVDAIEAQMSEVVTRYGADVDISGMTASTSVAGAALMAFPSQVIQADGAITSVEVVQPASVVTPGYLLIFDYDGVNTYTLVSSTPLQLVPGYNNVPVDVLVRAGQVLGIGGVRIGTLLGAVPAIRTLFSSSAGATVLVDGTSSSSNFAWLVNFHHTQKAFATGSSVARKTARVIEWGGQSNADGQGSAPVNIAAYGNKMFASGIRTTSGTSIRTSLAAMEEATRTTGLAIASAYATELEMARIGSSDWSDLDTVFFGASSALEGRNIETLFDYSGDIWPVCAANIRAAGNLLRREGYDPFFAYYVWIHGYSNRADARNAYAAKLRAAIARVRGAAGAGMAGVPFFIGAQMPHHKQGSPTRNPTVALDLRDVAMEVGGEVFPLYPAEWDSTGIHMTTKGNVYKGLMIGKMMYDLSHDAGFRHIHFRVKTWGATSVVLELIGGNGSYMFDTSTIEACPNMGFDVHDASGNLLSIVSGASLSGREVTLTTSRAIANGERITYGWGRSEMPIPASTPPGPYRLGNLRDTDGRSRTVSGTLYNLWNWAVLQEVVKT